MANKLNILATGLSPRKIAALLITPILFIGLVGFVDLKPGHPEITYTLAIALFCISSSFVWFSQGLRILVLSGAKVSSYFEVMGRELINMLPYAIALASTKFLAGNPMITTLIMVACLGVFGLRRVRFLLGAKR